MKVVFIEEIKGVAKRGDIKEVSEGYARNFLFVNNLAVVFGSVQANQVIAQAKNTSKHASDINLHLLEIAKKLAGEKREISTKINSRGGYYAAISKDALNQLFGIDKELIHHIEWPKITKPGEYSAIISINEKKFELKIEAKGDK